MCCQEIINFFGNEKAHCIERSNVAKENNKQFRIESSSNSVICRLKIDGCIINDNTIVKCDYVFKICDIDKLIFVELKGTDVNHAIQQIVTTLDNLKHLIKTSSIEAYIISSSVPRAAEQNFRNLKDKIFKNKGLKITKFHSQGSIKL